MFEFERTKEKSEKIIPLKTEESSNSRLLVAKSTSVKILANFQRKRGSGENFLRCKLSIYRGEGGSFKKTASI
jgi:hypothetical protein